MKTPSSLRFLLAAGAPGALLLFLPVSSPAQVVIEAGPGVVQISDQDGKTEPVMPGGVPSGAPIGLRNDPPPPVIEDLPVPKAVVVQPDPRSSTTVLVPMERPAATLLSPERPLDPESVPSAVPQVNVDVAKRKAEIARELGLLDSGTGASLSLLADGLYQTGTTEIASTANAQLQLFSEFVRLSEEEGLTVTYHYFPDLHNEEMAWKRALSLVEWLKVSGGLSASKFSVLNPEILTKPTPTVGTGDGTTALPENKVVLVVDYR